MPAKVKVYTRRWCGYCVAALSLLDGKGIDYEHIDATGDAATRAWLVEATGQRTVPQIFIDDRSIGGFSELRRFNHSGELDRMLAG